MDTYVGIALVLIGGFSLGAAIGYKFGWVASEHARLVSLRDGWVVPYEPDIATAPYTVQRDPRPDDVAGIT